MARIGAKTAVRMLLLTLLCVSHLVYVEGQCIQSRPTLNPAPASITENDPVGTTVTIPTGGSGSRIEISGGSCGATATWSALNAACATNFQLQVETSDTKNAFLKVLSPVDFEIIRTFSCEVTATSNEINITVRFTINVNNVFDVTPTFSTSSYSCSIEEEQAAGTQLTGCAATFTDSELDLTSPYTPDTVTCSLSGTHAAYFSVLTTTSTKTCTPTTNSKFDRDFIPTSLPASTLTFNIIVRNSVGLQTTRPVTVTVTDINDNTPTCSINPISVTVSEVYTGSIVSSMSCTDRDSGVNAAIRYSFLDPASSRYFSVDINTGQINAIVPLDFDVSSTSNYSTVIIKVADQGTPTALSTSVTVSVTITPVNDNTPAWGTFNPAWTSATAPITSISENADSGFVVFSAVATDADKGSDGTLTYSIQSAKGSDLSNLLTAFKINSVTGEVSINIKGVLNREIITYADITVLANDNPTLSTPLTITRDVRVTINDYNEFPPAFVPSSGVYSAVTVAEGLAAGSPVLVLSVTDPDASATAVTCSITGGNTGSVFKMNSSNAKQIDTNIVIEPDKPTSQPTQYILTVTCADAGAPTALTSTATVSVSVSLTNDNTPTISMTSTNITIPENQVPGLLSSITAGDNDAGTDGNYTCALTPASSPFSVSTACDRLYLTQTVDRETIASYSMILTITDGGSPPKSATLSFTVTLSDINDNNPVCTPSTYLASFAETSPPIASLVTLTCSDPDTFGIYYSSNTTHFAVDSSTGVVSYTGGADYDTGVSTYKVVVYAVDKNDVNKFATANVFVTLTNVNEFTPTFTNKGVSVAETVNGGQLVTSFVATDADASPDNIKTYRITSGDSSGYFTMNNAGDIFVASGRLLDYEALSAAGLTTFTLTVEAADGGTPPKTGSGTLTITVTDVNDNAPVFTQSTYTGSVTEGTTTVASVVTVVATDADITAAFKAIRYSFSPTLR